MVQNVDHLVYTVPRLEDGIARIKALLGVRPVVGGRHPDFGSHNALLSLGPETYLEVVAPDPELPRPERGLIFGMDHLEAPRLATWALRSESMDSLVRSALENGVDLGLVDSGRRQRPDGTVLSWRLSDPRSMLLDGLVPFAISWGSTPHPAGDAPSGGSLVSLRAEHADPERVRSCLAALGVEMEVRAGDASRLVATLRTVEGGVVELS